MSLARSNMPEGDPFLELLVEETGSARVHYDLVHLRFEQEGATVSVNLIAIGRISNCLIVVFVKEVWSRQVAERLLPRAALQKPILIEVAVALQSSPEEAVGEETSKLWLGLLDRRLEKDLVPGRDLDALADVWFDDIQDGELRMPMAEALVEAAENHFAFQSAAEEPPIESRMAVLEETMKQIHQSGSKDRRCKSFSQWLEDRRARSRCGGIGLGSRDPRGAVEKAGCYLQQDEQDAGFPQHPGQGWLRHLGRVGRRRRGGCRRGRRSRGCRSKRIRGSQQPPHREGRATADQTGGTYGKAISEGLRDFAGWCRWRIRRHHHFRRRQKQSCCLPEAEVSPSGQSDFYLPEHRSPNARGLRSGEECPRSFAEGGQQQGLGRASFESDEFPIGSEGHLDHCRHPRLHQVGGLCRGSKSGLSGFSCLGSGVLLEEPPPYQSFAQHRVPESWEQAATKLIDERWMSVLQWRLKDRDAFIESKRRLSQARGKPDRREQEDGESYVNKDGKGKGKKGKDKEKDRAGKEGPALKEG